MWQDIFTALALVFVIEGILPFLSPSEFRKVLIAAARLDERTLRLLGLTSMTSGVVLLYLI